MRTQDSYSTPDTVELRTQRAEETTATVELVHRYQQGDMQALDPLFARYYPRVLRCVRARMGPLIRRHYEAEDVVQRVFADALKVLKTAEVTEPGKLIHLFSKMAENQLRGLHDYLTTGRRDVRLEKSLESLRAAISSGSIRFDPVDDGTGVVDGLSREEVVAIVDDCLLLLKEKYREVILMRNVAGCSWEYIAEQMGYGGEPGPCMLHRRARRKLLELLVERVPSLRLERPGESEG